MTKAESAMFELKIIRREQDSVETQVSWYIDNRTSDDLLSDSEYQELESQAFDLFFKERELVKQIERDEFLSHEARLASV